MSTKLRRTREDMLREWDEDFSQLDREDVAYQLHKLVQTLTPMFYEAEHAGLHELAGEFERGLRMFKLAKAILAFDPDRGEP